MKKNKSRALRRRRNRRVAYREWKEHHSWHVEHNVNHPVIYSGGYPVGLRTDVYEVDCACDVQVNRFNKKDAWDCGNTSCYICHSDKFPKRTKTYQEWVAQKRLEEGIEELYDSSEVSTRCQS
jgi:hypothetical protein